MGKIIFFSGAGISAESGVPLYRGGEGLWDEYRLDQVCNYMTWKDNFQLVHEFYSKRRAELATVEPNDAHKAIARWSKGYEVVNLTQNVDDLFERAGCEGVTHLHGFLPEMRCENCGNTWNIGYEAWDPMTQQCPHDKGKLPCNCRKGVKPNVVFFHEDAPEYRKLYKVLKELTPDDIVVVIGTSGQVIPIHHMLVDKWGKPLPGYKVLVNLDSLDPQLFHEELLMPATQAIGRLEEIIREKLGEPKLVD